jgi:hypothetical protein
MASQSNYRKATVESMLGEDGLEAVNYALQKAWDNCMDPNTKADAIRSVTIDIKLKPTQDRSEVATTIELKSKLQGDRPISGRVYLSKNQAGVNAWVHKLDQDQLPGIDEDEQEAAGNGLSLIVKRQF